MQALNSDGENRQKIISRTSILGITANLLLGLVKFVLGNLTHSQAVSADALNNVTDSASSLITLIGTKLAARRPDRKHPFGYGRMEYLTSLVIGVLILVSGLEAFISSVKHIITPELPDYSWLSIGILALTVLVKIVLGLYTQSQGRKTDSGALVASGKDALSDAAVSAVMIASALLYIFLGWNLDAWTSALISLVIVKAGIDTLIDTLNQILGERADADLAGRIKKQINSEPFVIGCHDLILNDYGPGSYIGSCNLEVKNTDTIGELYPLLHGLQMDVYRKEHVYLVFGLYAIDLKNENTVKMKGLLASYQKSHAGMAGFHGVFVDDKDKEIFCDVVLDFGTDCRQFVQDLNQTLSEAFPGWTFSITVDTQFV